MDGTDEWYKLEAMDEKYAACKIPDEILSELSTMQLLELVLDCPMLQFITYSDSFYEGIEMIRENFNGMEELLNRYDMYSTVLKYYSKLNIPKKLNINLDKMLPDKPTQEDYEMVANNDKIMKNVEADLKVKYVVNFCQTILCSRTENASVYEVNHAKNVLNNKFIKIEDSEYRDMLLTKEDLADADWTDEGVITENLNPILRNLKQVGKLKTKGGKEVKYVMTKNIKKVDEAEKYHIEKLYNGYINIDTGKNVIRVMGGTTGYDCYNYAWLYNDKVYKEKFWKKCDIESDQPYRNDGSYGHTNGVYTTNQIGSNGRHAVIVTKKKVRYRTPNGQVITDVLVKSKWGTTGPLIEHPLHMGRFSDGQYSFYC